MSTLISESSFSQFGSCFPTRKNGTAFFKNHSQFTIMADILSRKQFHHIIARVEFSANLYEYFFESLMIHLNQIRIPSLYTTNLFHLDLNKVLSIHRKQKSFNTEFLKLLESTESTPTYLLFALSYSDLYSCIHPFEQNVVLQNQFRMLFTHPQCRFIIMNCEKLTEHPLRSLFASFTEIIIKRPNAEEAMLILKSERDELENFHHVVIPDELVEHAYALTQRYLDPDHTLEKALLLLDSCAARTNALDANDQARLSKPVMSLPIMLNVLSGWTQIPSTHLSTYKFKNNEFIQSMQQKIFGQETALTLLSHALQQVQYHLPNPGKPFCSLLFAGHEHSGKHATAVALTEQIFKQSNMLYVAQFSIQSSESLFDIKLHRYKNNYCINLKELIKHTPYAVLLFEQIEKASQSIWDELQEILSTGFLNHQGHAYNCTQLIIILTTTLGAAHLTKLEESNMVEEESSNMDLLQWVTREQMRGKFSAHHYSPQEIADEMSLSIMNTLPAPLCQLLNVIPFIGLTKSAIEKIIQLKLALIGKELSTRHEIELSYAPEVIRFLTSEKFKKEMTDHTVIDVEKALKQLNFILEQAIHYDDNKNRSNQLFLQLNESGQVLRYDWLTTAARSRKHAP